MCFHGNQLSWGIKHPLISLWSKYCSPGFICLSTVLAPVISSLDEIYCIYRKKPNIERFYEETMLEIKSATTYPQYVTTLCCSLATGKWAKLLQNIWESCGKFDLEQCSLKNLSKYWYFSENTWKCVSMATSYHGELSILWLVYDPNITPLPSFVFPQCLPPLSQV